MDDQALLTILRTDPLDVGCEQTWEMIHVYAELVFRGENPEAHFPGITAHLRSCAPCDLDFHGVLHAVREEAVNGEPR